MVELKVTTNKLSDQGSKVGYTKIVITKAELEELAFDKLRKERSSEAHIVIDIEIIKDKGDATNN